MLTVLSAVGFSSIIAFAAQNVILRSSVFVDYKCPFILFAGSDFNSKIPDDCQTIIFDTYSSVYDDKISGLNEVPVNYANASLEADGVCLFEDSTNKTVYVLCKKTIYANQNCLEIFYNKQNLQNISFNNFNTSRTTQMNYMFQNCLQLQLLDLSMFDTSNVNCMYKMFANCSSLTSLNLSNFNTEKVTTFASMFYGCSKLKELDLAKFRTDSIQHVSSMFQDCSELITIYVNSQWDVSVATASGNMFSGCVKLVGQNGTIYADSNPKDKTYAVIDGKTLPGYLSARYKLISGSNFKTYISSSCTEIIFDKYSNRAAEVSGVTGTNVALASNGVSTTSDIQLYKVGTTIYVLSDGTIMANEDCSKMFYGGYQISSIQFNNFNTSNVQNMSYMFDLSYVSLISEVKNKSLTSLDISMFNTMNVTNMSYMFNGCVGLTSLNLVNFDTRNVTNMSHMFDLGTLSFWALGEEGYDYNNLTSITLGYFFTTSKVTDMSYMFANCTNLTSLNLYRFDTSKVTNMSGMFYRCSSLTSLDVSSFNTSEVTDMSGMFDTGNKYSYSFAAMYESQKYDYYKSNLKTIKLNKNKFITTKVTNMSNMFSHCVSLENIDVSNFDTSNVTDMGYMFNYCGSLTSLDLTSFNTSKVTNMDYMLAAADLKKGSDEKSSYVTVQQTQLTTIYVGANWNTSSVTSSENMFYYCEKLVGQNGTTYNNSNPKDKTYACVDGENSNPGYLTAGYSIKYNFKNAIDENCTKIIFDKYENKSSEVIGLEATNISIDMNNEETDDIKLYYNETTKTTYVLSSGVIFANEDCSGMFYNLTALEEIDFNNFNTSRTTNMGGEGGGGGIMGGSSYIYTYGMFSMCTSLKRLDLTCFDTSNVTNMAIMFYGCSALEVLDLRSFVTSSSNYAYYGIELGSSTITDDFFGIFEDCAALTKIYVGDLWSGPTAAIQGTFNQFENCGTNSVIVV